MNHELHDVQYFLMCHITLASKGQIPNAFIFAILSQTYQAVHRSHKRYGWFRFFHHDTLALAHLWISIFCRNCTISGDFVVHSSGWTSMRRWTTLRSSVWSLNSQTDCKEGICSCLYHQYHISLCEAHQGFNVLFWQLRNTANCLQSRLFLNFSWLRLFRLDETHLCCLIFHFATEIKDHICRLMAHSHCTGLGTGQGPGTGPGTELGMGKWVYNPLAPVPIPCPCVVWTVHSIIHKPIVPGSVPGPGPMQCEWAIMPFTVSRWRLCNNHCFCKLSKWFILWLLSWPVRLYKIHELLIAVDFDKKLSCLVELKFYLCTCSKQSMLINNGTFTFHRQQAYMYINNDWSSTDLEGCPAATAGSRVTEHDIHFHPTFCQISFNIKNAFQ